jgi:hypothetical protein
MAHVFNEEEREDLLERGFNNEQLQFLESLEIAGIYFDICKIMDDYDYSPSRVMFEYQRANGTPITGGKRKRERKRKTTRNNRSRRTKKNRKGKRGKKSYKRR